MRRSDIAERLHDVMETQWIRTLAIITNPSTEAGGDAANKKMPAGGNMLPADRLDRIDGVAKLYHNRPENEGFETRSVGKMESSDKLQKYIELVR